MLNPLLLIGRRVNLSNGKGGWGGSKYVSRFTKRRWLRSDFATFRKREKQNEFYSVRGFRNAIQKWEALSKEGAVIDTYILVSGLYSRNGASVKAFPCAQRYVGSLL